MFEGIGLLTKSVMSVGGAIALIWGGMVTLDARYERQDVHDLEHGIIQTGMETFSITILKKEIREIRTLLRTVTDPHYRAQLEDDLEDIINRLCQVAPTDRECTQ